ncbi:MAG: hypothetical protein AAFO89_03890 [Planctomycetota bacterium]
MRCLLLTDSDIALRESALIHRLVIGLLDAGVHVAHAAPESVLSRIEPSLGVESLAYRSRGFSWTRPMRAAELLSRFERVTEVSSGDPGLVHVIGGGSLALGAEIARAGDLSLVIDAHARSVVPPVARLLGERSDGVVLAGSRSIADALLAEGLSATGIREVRWGVSPADGRAARSSETVSIAIGGLGASADDWARCLRGVAEAAAETDSVAVFADADACERARIGPLIGALGLSPLFSRVPDFESRRELVVRSDVLLWPESTGETRSLVLDAMAHQTPVVALADRDVSCLATPGPAELVSGDQQSWMTAVQRLIGSEEHRRNAGAAGAEYVRLNHSASAHVGAVVDAYEWAASGARAGGAR